jgi:hypothetical protein
MSHNTDLVNALRRRSEQRLRRQRHVRALHRLGARAIGELLDELDRYHGLGEDLDQRLDEAYATRLTSEMLYVTGGDRFPAAPIHRFGGGL